MRITRVAIEIIRAVQCNEDKPFYLFLRNYGRFKKVRTAISVSLSRQPNIKNLYAIVGCMVSYIYL